MQRHASVVIFGGTSEGRELAEYAEAHHIPVLVSVVSGYGESLLRESDLVQVHTGALDEAAMRQFLREAARRVEHLLAGWNSTFCLPPSGRRGRRSRLADARCSAG